MLNKEDTKTLNEYFARKTFSKEVVDALWKYCTSMKEARSDAVLYTTQANILFRTSLSRNGTAFSLNPTKDTILFTTDFVPQKTEYQIGEQRRFGWEFFIVCNPCKNHPEKTSEDFFSKAIGAGIDCWDQGLLHEARKKVKNYPRCFVDDDFVAAITDQVPYEYIAQMMVEMLQNHPDEAPVILKKHFAKYTFGDNEDPFYAYLLETCPQIVPYFSIGSFICAYQAKVEVMKQIIKLGEWNRPYPWYMLADILECDFSLVDKLDYSGAEIGDWVEIVSKYFNHYIEEKKVKTDELYSHIAKIASHCPDDSWSKYLDKEDAERVWALLNSGDSQSTQKK